LLRNLFRRVADLLSGPGEATDELFEQLEEVLIASDVSVRVSALLVARVRSAAREQRVRTADGVRAVLRDQVAQLLSPHTAPLITQPVAAGSQPALPPLLYLVVGVNGTGKTTTIAKLAARFQRQGRRVLLAAGDTFRAAAIEQLEVWARRLNAEMVSHQAGGDPAAVIFDSISAARARGCDVVIADTAGRLHTKRHLMEELEKIARVVERELGRPADETLLVLDATTGQNALTQAQQFHAAIGLTGVVMTKLDGTAKGGMVITISEEMGLPIKLIGVGEKLEDLEDFDPAAFATALL
jgi:fused signal recognition particle receptor